MSNLFSVPNLTNNPTRSGFDLSFKNSFTAKIGELLPIMHRSTLPGDKFKIQIQHRTVTMPLQTSAFTRFTEYFDFFFVPYDQLYRQAPRILTQMQNNPQYAQSITSPVPVGENLPWFNLSDWFDSQDSSGTRSFLRHLYAWKEKTFQGFGVWCDTLKLWNYLGYPHINEEQVTDVNLNSYPTNRPYSVLPFAAYQKIYFDHYRFEQWENNAPQCYNFDYLPISAQLTRLVLTSQDRLNNIFTLRHCNYPKDLFHGMLPSPQYGDPSLVLNSSWQENISDVHELRSDKLVALDEDSNGNTPVAIYSADSLGGTADDPVDANIGFSIVQLRQAKALQRYREVIGTGNQDYKSMVKKIWGEDVPEYTSHTVRYLGGFRNEINVNSIINNNLDTKDSQASMKGFADGTDEPSRPITFDCDEHGIIMCIYRVLPLLDYALDAPHFDTLKTEVDDFANPFFDRLGLQELPALYLDDYSSSANSTIGYVPRYFDYKTSVDVVNGSLRGTLKNWIAAFTRQFFSSWLPSAAGGQGVTKDFFKVNSHLVDSVFFLKSTESVNTDQFVINANFDITAVRNLDYKGLPIGN